MTELNYTLDKEDYLNLQLYSVSQNSQIYKQRRQMQIKLLLIIFVGTVLFLVPLNLPLVILVLVMGIPLVIFYPKLASNAAKNNLRRFVYSNYADRCPEQVTLTFGADIIETQNPKASSKLKTKYMQRFVETGDYFFIYADRITMLMIPKKQYQDVDFIRHELTQQSKAHNIPFEADLDWKWR